MQFWNSNINQSLLLHFFPQGKKKKKKDTRGKWKLLKGSVYNFCLCRAWSCGLVLLLRKMVLVWFCSLVLLLHKIVLVWSCSLVLLLCKMVLVWFSVSPLKVSSFRQLLVVLMGTLPGVPTSETEWGWFCSVQNSGSKINQLGKSQGLLVISWTVHIMKEVWAV